jgi:hypothetical protein
VCVTEALQRQNMVVGDILGAMIATSTFSLHSFKELYARMGYGGHIGALFVVNVSSVPASDARIRELSLLCIEAFHPFLTH